jgi:hypothetical protein
LSKVRDRRQAEGKGAKQGVFDHGLGGLVGLRGETKEARGALMNHRHGLVEFSEAHEIGFPVAGRERLLA